jgi:CheY-like chemotaxis protein
VEIMGGAIGVESRPGAGATFWFQLTLPLDPSPPQVAQPPADLTGLRVLVVDDHEINRKVALEMLAGWGMRCAAAASGAAALTLLRRAAAAGEPFQVASLDYQRPDIDGPALARAIKSDAGLRELMLVMVTSLGQEGEARLMQETGFSVYLVKPVQPSQLFDLLAAAWAQHLQGRTGELLTRHSLSAVQSQALLTRATEFSSRVLVVEDNVISQRVAALCLESLGYRVDLAANGREALNMVEMLSYDLVLLDCEMPEMDGFEATREIRRREEGSGRHLPIVAMTARALQGDRERCLSAGMDDYLSKPVSLGALSATILRHVGGREAAASVPSDSVIEPRSEHVLETRRVEELRSIAGTRQNLERLIDCFSENAGVLMERLHAAAASGDAAELKSAAHSLKGSCANLGAGSMVSICAALDELGGGGAFTGVTTLLERLDREFALVREELAALRCGDGSAGTTAAAGDTIRGGES